MPKCYRRFILASFGWLIVAASPSGQQNHTEQLKTQREIAATLKEIAASLGQTNNAKSETVDCPKGADNRRSDLCAEWKAADAGEESASAAWASFYLGVIGSVLGAITMSAAIAAAIFAKRAAEETRRGALAAESTLNHSKEVSDRQLRAYLFPVDTSIKLSKGDQSSLVHVSVPMVNSGQTPAKLIFYSILAKYKSPKTVQAIIDHTKSEWIGTVKQTTNVQQLIGPNGKTVIPLYTSMPTGHFDHSKDRVGYLHERPSTIMKIELEWSYQDYAGRTWSEIAVFTSANIKWDTITDLTVDMPQTEAKTSNRIRA